jgi:hypothetical protein
MIIDKWEGGQKMIALIGLILAVVISFAWYYPVVKAQGDRALLQGKDYARIALVYGFCFTTLLIIITEITWDAIVKRTGLSGLPRDIVADFYWRPCWKSSLNSGASCLLKRNWGSGAKSIIC